MKKKHMKHKDKKQEQESHYLLPRNEHNTESLASAWQQTCILPEHSGKLLRVNSSKTIFF